MPELEDTCLDTPEALLLDGANGVCDDARDGAGTGHVGHAAFALIVSLIVAAGLSAKRVSTLARRAVVIAVLVLCALPGVWALLTMRADSPRTLDDTAREALQLHDEIRDFAVRHPCARAEHAQCVECFPATRLALSGLSCDRAPARPATIVLRAGALDGRCEEHGDVLVCGRRAR